MRVLTRLVPVCFCICIFMYPPADTAAQQTRGISSFPVVFEKNFGASSSSYPYLSRHGNVDAYFAPDRVELRFPGTSIAASELQLRVIGQSAQTFIEPASKVRSVSNYLLGADPSKWRTGVANYSELNYRQIYPGIDLVFHGSGNRLEYDFRVTPGSDPGQVQFAFDPGCKLSLDSRGDIRVQAGPGILVLQKPTVYQEMLEPGS